MANERVTENLVRDKLRNLGYYSENNSIRVEEQKSEISEIKKNLKNASKTGKNGIGSPEFIITSSLNPDIVIIIECKAETNKHESPEKNKIKDYAVDGVLHYSSKLKKSFNVIGIAVSGDKESNLKISTFLYPKESSNYKNLTNKLNTNIEDIIPFEDFVEYGSFDEEVEKKRHKDLMSFSKELHDFMRDNAKLTESEKPLLVSGTLIALKNSAFAKSFGEYTPDKLQKQWFKVIEEEFNEANIPHSKKTNMVHPYSSIAFHPELGKPTSSYPRGVLHELITMLNEKVYPFIKYYHDYDVVGQFYGEFLKYTGGDKKALGIVLTPRHITELFALLSNLNKETKVLDICTGTGGFLISAMHQMMKKAITNEEKEFIKKECLIGVEQQPNMYALGASNMILRGDGKANLYQGSCFDEAISKEIKEKQCDIGLINPPYSQVDKGLHELSFVNHMLLNLKKGGTGIAIIPVNCVLSPHPLKEELLKNHTLEAVMSMPNEVFYPVGVVTCIIVFKANIPHNSNEYHKTWFGYWKDDGFVKTKHLGRVDLYNNWENVRNHWLDMYHNKIEKPGESVKTKVSAKDEWCAEAYMETDYSNLKKEHFEENLKQFLMFKIMNKIN